ncbi:hypothetical protein LP52_24800 [Streptomonospora alba]|uniref:Transmembrane protein n=1 Tax=Streptomonospora alba TaxID=183763 RepID=A0A0C2J4Y5_9ACTN|nr:hypothetical protein [Streptomonospora alba]KIH96476.1 hypothetical protein LP52_24800 [Streptomonospora alba]
MSSSPLYLAIVVVWLIVLVPMLLRRDSAVHYEDDTDLDADLDDDPQTRPDDERADDGEDGEDVEDDGAEEAAPGDERVRAPEVREADVRRAHAARRASEPEPTRTLEYRDAEEPREEEAVMEAAPPPPAPRRRLSRATVIARRRRRTSGLIALLVLAGIGVATGLGPWWVLAPPAVLLLGHLALLREAAKADAERRVAELRRRRRAAELRRARAAREEAQAARRAQVIELMERRKEVYDQYTDAHQRAAGD